MTPTVLKVAQAFDESTDNASPERRLMMGIILTAINDATGHSAVNDTPDQRVQSKHQARHWFERHGDDFQTVCILAGFDPEKVRRAALVFIAAHSDGGRKRGYGTLEAIMKAQQERLAA